MSIWGFREPKSESSEESDKAPEEWTARALFLERAVRNLLILTKGFAFDAEEVQVAEFKRELDRFLEELPKEWRVQVLEKKLARCQEEIQEFHRCQLSYIADREAEFKEIIDNLVSGLAHAGLENKKFCEKMESCGQALENVAKLDDIRKLKEALNEQVRFMSREIREKRKRDAEALDKMRESISHLHLELQSAVEEGRICPLTQVGNRRAFDEALQRHYEQCCLFWKPFALILVDVDNFKSVNDTYGHTAGDRVLANLARTLREHVRSDDLVARYGGEEFVVLLGGSSLKGARKRAKSLVKVVDKLAFMVEERREVPVTISAGVALLNKEDTPSSLLERADQALYTAKSRGKNRAVSEDQLSAQEVKGMAKIARHLMESLRWA